MAHKNLIIRIVAVCGFIVGILFLALLHFGAARTRVVGGHSGIFDFSQVGFLASFGDYFALCLMTLGVTGAVLGIYKGRHSLSDKRPGYLELYHATHDVIDNSARSIYETGCAALEETCEEHLEILRKSCEEIVVAHKTYNDAYRKKQHKDAEHNNRIDQTCKRFQVLIADETSRREYITQKEVKVSLAEHESFTAFKVQPLADALELPPFVNPLPALQTEINAALDKALIRIDTAWQDYLSPVEEFSLDNNPFTFNNSGDHHDKV